MTWRRRIIAFPVSRRTAKWSLGICIFSLVLWAYSGGIYYRPLEPLTVACRLPGALFQLSSQRGALHFLVMRQRWDTKAEFALERLTYLGNGGYPHGTVGALGFVFVLMPWEYNGGDDSIAPHMAVVIPYWFITGLFGAIVVRWVYLRYQGGESLSPEKAAAQSAEPSAPTGSDRDPGP